MTVNKQNRPTIMVAGGGTAGHIEPALAVAEAIRASHNNIEVLALGTKKGLDSVLIPQRGFPLEYTDPIPLPRSVNKQLVTLPFRVIRSVWKTKKIIKEHNVQVIIGFGGYVALSAYLAAQLPHKVPLIVHEANVKPGLANRIGKKLATVSLASHEISHFSERVVGTPVRSQIAELHREQHRLAARAHWGLPEQGTVILVFGGSQGAQRINQALTQILPELLGQGINVLHAYGSANTPALTEQHPDTPGKYVGIPYIDAMELAYSASDLAIARSGAMTVAELSSVGLPAIYVPLGHGNGEQALNAADAVTAGAARLIEDSACTGDALKKLIAQVLEPTTFAHMNQQSTGLSQANAAAEIAQIAVELVKRN